MAVTRAWKVYGVNGKNQREARYPSRTYYWSNKDDGVRILEFRNYDQTGTREYTIVAITRDTAVDCANELSGQITDGWFENSDVGKVEEITLGELNDAHREK